MGLFSKVFKGIGKVFRKIGRGLKKIAAKFGKFMGKIGIIGQIGLSLLLPGIGAMFGKLAGAMMGSSSAIISGAGNVLNAAINIGTKVGSTFRTITEGVTKVIGDVAGAALNKIPGAGDLLKTISGGKLDITSKTFSGAWQTAQNAITDVAAAGKDLFSMSTLTAPNQTLKDIAAQQVTEAARDQALSSVPDSLALPEAASASTFELPNTGLQQTEGAGFFSGTAQPLQSPAVPEGSMYSPSLLEPTTKTGIPTKAVKGFVEQSVEDIVNTAKEFPKKFVDEVVDYGKNLPANLVEKAASGIETGAETAVMRAIGVDNRPIDKSTYIKTAVPYFDTSANIYQAEQMALADFSAMSTPEFNLNPIGYNAQMFNSKQVYDRFLQQGLVG
jgi:hypothetical protein